MKPFLFAIALFLSPLAAFGQGCGPTNPNCVVPTPAVTDVSNSAANTAWVNLFFAQGIPLPSGKIFVGSAGGLATPQAVSGDCTLAATGVITCTKTNGVAFSSLATTAPGSGVITAIGINVGTAGSLVVNGGALGTPSSGTLTNATGLPVSTGITGFGSNVQSALQNTLNASSGLVSFNGVLGTVQAGSILTNATGTAAGLTAGNVTTNANLTGDVTSVGNATTLTNAPVIAKVLTGYSRGAGTVSATDSILTAIQKVDGNDAVRISTVKKQFFSASGTYTPSTGMVFAIVECVAPGGGGGGTATTAASNYAAGGGGGGGAYSRVTLTAAQVGSSQTVTIGAGGGGGTAGNNAGNAGTSNTSLGTLCVAAPGGGGGGNSGSSLPSGGAGGAAASGTGDFKVSGTVGQSGVTSGSASGTSFVFIPSGAGGPSGLGFGAGAAGLLVSTATTGNAGLLYGGGGSGASTSNATGTAAGGAGANGAVYIQEFNTQ